MRVLSRYGPAAGVMAVIFALSATPNLNSGLGSWDLYLRKGAHITVYALLWLAVSRAGRWRRPLATTAFTLLYAAGDEYHQTFVAGRHGAPLDVAIDSVGMALAALACLYAAQRRGGRPGPPWPERFGGQAA